MPTPQEINAQTHGLGPAPNPFGFGGPLTTDPNFAKPFQAPIPAPGPADAGAPSAIPPLGQPFPVQAPAPGMGQALPVQMPVQMPAVTPRPVRSPGSGGGSSRVPALAGPPDTLDQDITKAGDVERQALDEKGQAIKQGGQDEAAALGDVAKARTDAADALAAKQEQNRLLELKLDADDNKNLELAKNKTIPAFWAGREGARVGSVIAVALSGAGSAMLGHQGNSALDAINHNVDSYFAREKDKIDNLFKFASAKRQVNDQTRHGYAQALLNLKDQHTYALEAARDRVAQVQAESKGNADAAQVNVLKAVLDKQIVQDRMEVRKLRAELHFKAVQEKGVMASAAASYANAAESRAGARLKDAQAENERTGMGKGGKLDGEALKSQGFADTAEANHRILQATPMSKQGLKTVQADLIAEENYNKNPTAKQVAMTLGQYKTLEEKLSPQDQRAWLAMRQFINADLRRESGAAIGASEFSSAQGRYFDAIGDAPQIRSQKAMNRMQSIHGMRIAGRQEQGGRPVMEQPQAQARPAQLHLNGKIAYLQPDGTYSDPR